MYTTNQTLFNSKISDVFLKNYLLHLFDPKYSKNSKIMKYLYFLNNFFLFEYILKSDLLLWSRLNFLEGKEL